MDEFIPYGKQTIDKKDINIVKIALKKNLITTGSSINLFEKKFAKKINAKYAISCNSGTSAIHLALLAINLKKNDCVILPAINFPAAANMCRVLGSKIFFADVSPNTGQMSPLNLVNCLEKNKIKKLKVFFVMHNSGFNNYAEEFYFLKKKYKCFLIEDACHALGAKNSEKKRDMVGNCKYSDITIFSLHALKSITTAEGGVITTNNKYFSVKMKRLRNHGFDVKKKNTHYNYNWRHKLLESGFNYRLNDIQCHLGLSQLNKLDKFIKKRNNIAKIYLKFFDNLKDYIELPNYNKYLSAWHLFVIKFRLEKLKISRDLIMQKLFRKKILTQVHYIPNYKHKPFLVKNYKDFTGSEYYYSRCLSLPIFPSLSFVKIHYIVKQINNIIVKYKKI